MKHFRKTCKTQLRIWTKFFVQYILHCKIISACKFTSHSRENEGLTYRQGGGPAHKYCNIGWKMKCQGLIILHHFYISTLLSIYRCQHFCKNCPSCFHSIYGVANTQYFYQIHPWYFQQYMSAFLFLFSSTNMVGPPGVWECRCWE